MKHTNLLPLDVMNNATIQELTPRLLPVFQHVLGPPQEQLEDETRQLVEDMVRILNK